MTWPVVYIGAGMVLKSHQLTITQKVKSCIYTYVGEMVDSNKYLFFNIRRKISNLSSKNRYRIVVGVSRA